VLSAKKIRFYFDKKNLSLQKNCQALGGNLVSVHSKAENDFVLSLVPSSSTRFWAGAHDGEQVS